MPYRFQLQGILDTESFSDVQDFVDGFEEILWCEVTDVTIERIEDDGPCDQCGDCSVCHLSGGTCYACGRGYDEEETVDVSTPS